MYITYVFMYVYLRKDVTYFIWPGQLVLKKIKKPLMYTTLILEFLAIASQYK